MTKPMPRIAKVAADGQTSIIVQWKGGKADHVDLAGWIATGGDVLAPLTDPGVFQRAAMGDYGASVVWDDGDLAIDAAHLEALAAEQRPFGADDMAGWQATAGLSNQEAADFLAVSLSTWHTYKTGAKIPVAVAMACRAALRDPILLQAHYRPRKAGRPKTTAPA